MTTSMLPRMVPERPRLPRPAPCLLLIAVLLGAGPAWAQDAIGNASEIETAAFRTPVDLPDRLDLHARDPVFQLDRVSTPARGRAEIQFVDETSLTVGPLSEVLLDEFVFNPGAASGAMVIDITRGAFRFASGRMPREGVEIRTPTATLGIRGTIFDVYVSGPGSLRVVVWEGEVSMTAFLTGQTTLIPAGQQAVLSPAGGVTFSDAPSSAGPPFGQPPRGGAPQPGSGGGGGNGDAGSSSDDDDRPGGQQGGGDGRGRDGAGGDFGFGGP